MKILKKIGIGCIALVICFCSCFKFVNAQSSFTFNYNSNDTYYFEVKSVEEFENQAPIAFVISEDTDLRFILNYPIENPTIVINSPEGSNQETINTFYMGTLENGNNWYSFTPNVYEVANGTVLTYELNDVVNFSLTPFEEEDQPSFSVYNTIYDLIEKFIFGGNIEVGSHQDLTTTTLSSIICILVFALPFLIIWKVIKVIMG